MKDVSKSYYYILVPRSPLPVVYPSSLENVRKMVIARQSRITSHLPTYSVFSITLSKM